MSQHEDEFMGPGSQSPEAPGPFVGMPPMPTDPADWIVLLQNMAANQAQLQALLMNQANAPRQLASFNNMNMIKFSDPTQFSSKSKDVDSFVKTIQSRISSSPGTLVTDFQMVTYFASWLGSSILEKWFLGVQESQPSLLHDYLAFVQAFTNHFGDPDLVETAHRQLAVLWQTGSASTYVARFQEISVCCKHSDYDMHTRFVDGLKDEIQVLMLHDCPEVLGELYRLAIDIDGCLYKMKKQCKDFLGQFKSNSSDNTPTSLPPSTSSTSIPTPTPDPDAMEIDVYSVLNSNGKLTPAEKSCCQKLNLCLYCGCTGHQVKECPSKKGKSTVAAIASSPSSSSSTSSNPENADPQA